MSCFTTSFAAPSEGGGNVWVGECKALVGVGVCLEVSGLNGPGRKLTLDLCWRGAERGEGRDGGAGKGAALEETKRTKEGVGE
jgi:hypothetical protein